MKNEIVMLSDIHAADAIAEARAEARESKTPYSGTSNYETLRRYPQIGTICRDGKTIYYAYIGGYADSNYVESRILNVITAAIDEASR